MRGIGGYSCSDKKGVGMKWMYESIQRRVQSLGYLKHPNLAHLIGRFFFFSSFLFFFVMF